MVFISGVEIPLLESGTSLIPSGASREESKAAPLSSERVTDYPDRTSFSASRVSYYRPPGSYHLVIIPTVPLP